MAALALGCGPRPTAAPCPAPSAWQAGSPRSSAEQRALLWQREAVRVRKILAACQTGACFGAANKGTQVSDPRLSRCLQPLEREAEALASSRSPYVYGASAWLLERAEQCVAEPGGSAAFAALLSGRYTPKPDERVAVVVSGGNTTPQVSSR